MTQPRSGPTRPSSRRSVGLVALAILAISLTGCMTQQSAGETATSCPAPDYTPAFLECVAEASEAREWRPCVGEALSDWYVLAVGEDDDD